MSQSEQEILERLRAICFALPAATETVTFGHPTFRVQNKIFAVLETYKGELSICCKVGKSMVDVFLTDPRFYRTPYVGRHGWVSLRTAGQLDWEEVSDLVRGSHQLVFAGAKRVPGGSKRPK